MPTRRRMSCRRTAGTIEESARGIVYVRLSSLTRCQARKPDVHLTGRGTAGESRGRRRRNSSSSGVPPPGNPRPWETLRLEDRWELLGRLLDLHLPGVLGRQPQSLGFPGRLLLHAGQAVWVGEGSAVDGPALIDQPARKAEEVLRAETPRPPVGGQEAGQGEILRPRGIDAAVVADVERQDVLGGEGPEHILEFVEAILGVVPVGGGPEQVPRIVSGASARSFGIQPRDDLEDRVRLRGRNRTQDLFDLADLYGRDPRCDGPGGIS